VSKPSRLALSYNASNGSTPVIDARDYRYERRAQARKISHLDRVRKCGRTPIGQVMIGLKGGHATQRGLYTCGSVWACPVCSAKILTHRSLEIADALKSWESKGGSFVFQTLTLSHLRGDSVAKQRSMLTIGWKAISKGSFAKTNSRNGQVGYFKVLEPTFGKNGPHLHLHLVRFIQGEVSDLDLQQWMNKVQTRWSDAICAAGGRKPRNVAQHYRHLSSSSELQGYFTKNFDNPAYGVDWAIGSDSSNFPIWGLLSKALALPESQYRQAWNSYERQSKNMRQITWSRGFRHQLGLGTEILDEEVTRQIETFNPKVHILRESVRAFGNLGRLHSRVLRHIERGQMGLALEILNEHGIKFSLSPNTRIEDSGLP